VSGGVIRNELNHSVTTTTNKTRKSAQCNRAKSCDCFDTVARGKRSLHVHFSIDVCGVGNN
jgi:hypothetical protein